MLKRLFRDRLFVAALVLFVLVCAQLVLKGAGPDDGRQGEAAMLWGDAPQQDVQRWRFDPK